MEILYQLCPHLVLAFQIHFIHPGCLHSILLQKFGSFARSSLIFDDIYTCLDNLGYSNSAKKLKVPLNFFLADSDHLQPANLTPVIVCYVFHHDMRSV